MENIELLFERNNGNGSGIKLDAGRLIIRVRATDYDNGFNSIMKQVLVMMGSKESKKIEAVMKKRPFSGLEINRIISMINAAHAKYKTLKFSVILDLDKVVFIDKLTYVFLECICYILIVKYHHPVYISMQEIKDIGTSGITSSPLLLLNTNKREKMLKFIEKFKFDIFHNHYRRVISGKEKENTNFLGELYKEIDTFLIPFGIECECRDKVGLVITELVGNACEHAKAECLIDIDVAPDYQKYEKDELVDDNNYYGINITIINFSDKLLGDDVGTNILSKNIEDFEERYKQIFEAYSKHSQNFDELYNVEDFRNITVFQNRISGRGENHVTGGTGLTNLIRSLEERSDMYRCYVISGKKSLNFYKELLIYNKEGWIGFNESNDYINEPPKEGVIGESFIFMPGTAYNLNFVMQGEKVNEE